MAVNPQLTTTIVAGKSYFRLTPATYLTNSIAKNKQVVNGQGALKNPNGSRYSFPATCTVYLTEDVSTCLSESMFYFHRAVLPALDAQFILGALPMFYKSSVLWEITFKKDVVDIADLRGNNSAAFNIYPCLMLNPSQDYHHLRNARGVMQANGYRGLIAPSTRVIGGGNMAVLFSDQSKNVATIQPHPDAAAQRVLTDKITNLPPNRTTGKPISIITARWWLRELGAAFEWFSHPDSRIGWMPPYPQWREKFSINDGEAKALAKHMGDENFGKVKPIFNLEQLAILHKNTTPLDRLYLLGGVCLGWTAIEFATLKRDQIQTEENGETYIVNKERSKTGVEMTFWVCPELAELLKRSVAATPPNPGDLAMMTRNRRGDPLPLVHNGTDTISQSWNRLLRRVNKTEQRVPKYPHSRLRKLAGQLVENITGNHDLAQMVLSHKRKDVASTNYVAIGTIIGVGKSPQQRLWDAQREVHTALAPVLSSLPPTAKDRIVPDLIEDDMNGSEIAA